MKLRARRMLVFSRLLGAGWIVLIGSMLSVLTPVLANEYTIGIAPQQSASELAKRWVPIIKYWSDTAGHSFHFRTAKDIDTFQKDLSAGLYDIMFVNAHHYTVFNQTPGYAVFAHEMGCANAGIIVVAKSGEVQRLEQLSGATIAFSSPNAVIGTWLPGAHLANLGVAFVPKYVKSMDSVYLGVAKGLFPAGGGELRTFGSLDAEIKSNLRILWKNEFPCHPFSAHPRVPPEVVQQLQKAMLGMHKNTEGVSMLKLVNIQGFVASKDADYQAVRKLNLKPFEVK
jgi:phosphonate transport system substrate-binding protein